MSAQDAAQGGLSEPLVWVIVITFNGRRHLDACFSSLHRTEYSNWRAMLVDNASTDGAADFTAATFPWVTIMRHGKNLGFAAGNNRGIADLDSRVTFVFLLNPDAEVECTAIGRCVTSLAAASASTVSAAPKMLLHATTATTTTATTAATTTKPANAAVISVDLRPDGIQHAAVGEPENIIDAVANAINARGEAFNIGLGQPDLGQYDEPQPCFGPCFGAALFRRSAFLPEQVGPLDESLFLYYEDVEWNWRAQILGFESITVPGATVTHVMSASTRDLPYDFKFRLTERNLLVCVVLCVPGPEAFWIAGQRIVGLLFGSIKGHYPVPGLRAVGGLLSRLPGLLVRRRRLRKRRIRSHSDILCFGAGERTFFDPVRYMPVESVAARRFAEQRLRGALRAHSMPPVSGT